MRRLPLFLVFVVLGHAAAAQREVAPLNEDDGAWPLTMAEKTDFRETTRYEDVVAMLDAIERLNPSVQVTSFGTTVEGRSLPVAVWGAPSASAESVLETGKTRVLVFANIHAGEVCGKEAALMLLREMARGEHAVWSDSLVVLVAPIYNADGNERMALDNRPLQLGPVGGMGRRQNAQGLDLNRDFMKLDAPESRALVALIRDYDPHVVVDLHTTDGTPMGYHLTYAPPLSPLTPERINRRLRGDWLPTVTASVRERLGYEMYHYGNIPGSFGEPVQRPRGWYSFSPTPRYSSNYVGLRGQFGILSEAFSYVPFRDRVLVTKGFVTEVLEYATRHASAIRDDVDEARRPPVVGMRLPLRADFPASADSVGILLADVDSVYHPQTGALMLRQTDRVRVERMPAHVRFVATETERMPRAYYVPEAASNVLALLDNHGVGYESVASLPGSLEGFVLSGIEESTEFEGHTRITVKGGWEVLDGAPAAGAWVEVSTRQPMSRLAFALLEPRAPDSVVSWGLFPASDLEEGEALPVLRTF